MPETIDLRKFYNGRPKFSWASQMAEYEYIQPRYLIKPFIPAATWGILYGHPDVGKTQLALSMAIGILDGGYFLGRFKCRKGRVGLIEVDTESPIMTERLQFLKKKHTWDEEDFGIAHYDAPIDIIQMKKAKKKYPDIFDWLEPMVENQFDLIVVDSLNKVHNLDEDSNATPKMVYKAFREILGSGPTILFIHHSRKDSMNPAINHRKDEHDARGAGALKADSNFMVKIYRTKADPEIREITWVKAKGVADKLKVPMKIMLNPETLLFQPEDEAFARAFPLVEVGISKNEVVQMLVRENLAGKTKAYDIYDKCLEIVGEE
jgi:RecA-family ATPase